MFSLESAIKRWRKNVRKNPSFEDGYIIELESHLRDDIESRMARGCDIKEAFQQSEAALGSVDTIAADFYKTDTRRISGRPAWQPNPWSPPLLAHYWRHIFRKMRRHAGHSIINISGLAVGLASCILIFLYVNFELDYDSYHVDADRVFRVAKSMSQDGQRNDFAANFLMLAPTLRTDFPEVEYALRLHKEATSPVRTGEEVFHEDGILYSEPDISNLFTISWLRGDPTTALQRPNTGVLTAAMAEKYFGAENPVGRTIQIDSRMAGRFDCEITGVVDDPPMNTHVRFGILVSWETLSQVEGMDLGWDSPMNVPTYVKLASGIDRDVFEDRISRLAHQYISEDVNGRGIEFLSFLQPLPDIHLYSHLNWELGNPGNPQYVYFFCVVGVLILSIACMNFTNLTTARAAVRASEVGLRKVVGALRWQLICQFLAESLLMSTMATVIALIMVAASMPYFNNLTGLQFTPADIVDQRILMGLLILAIGTGIVGGSYPAFYLSGFRPAGVLKGSFRGGARRILMRKVLVVGQFAISIILVIGTIIFYQQIEYMKSRPLGFQSEQKLVLKIPDNAMTQENHERIKNEFLQQNSITGATASSSVPGRWMYLWRLWPSGEEAENTQMVNCFQVDHDFLSEFGIELISGNTWSRDHGRGFVINEAAVTTFGWNSPDEAIGKTIGNNRSPIVGVVRNFHIKGLQDVIEPVGIFHMNEDFRYITLTVSTIGLHDSIASVETIYRRLFPESLFDSFFLDDDFNNQYLAEDQFSRIMGIFAGLGLFIACLGLFGMVSFIAEQRTKEIGVRKVLGASGTTIMRMLSEEFTFLVLIANVIAWPGAYYIMHGLWLADFAYRIDFEVGPFIIGGLIVFVIALVTMAHQALRAALSNPVETLNYE
ncbi:MAG: FtsX-like permease family protein [Candidatus Latescibacteria bacterium]|nr:FtsX-like permease family protein [Candidatus Latescibacterota bacterium]